MLYSPESSQLINDLILYYICDNQRLLHKLLILFIYNSKEYEKKITILQGSKLFLLLLLKKKNVMLNECFRVASRDIQFSSVAKNTT